MELVLPIYNTHPYFSPKTLGKNCALYMAKYGKFTMLMISVQLTTNLQIKY